MTELLKGVGSAYVSWVDLDVENRVSSQLAITPICDMFLQ